MSKSTFAHGQLKSLVERIERLEAEKATLAGDIREVYAEAKANGFDTKILRKVISLRKKEAAEREEEQSMIDVYLAALGMLADTPLGKAALARLRAAVLEICEVAAEKDRQCKVLARENERLRIGALTIAGHPELYGTKGADMARALVKDET